MIMRGILCIGNRMISAPRLVNILARRIEPLILNDKPAADVYKVALSCIEDAPTVDAVAVVRCRDCEFCNYNSSSETYKCMSMRGMYGTVDPDGFCSYGERRDINE